MIHLDRSDFIYIQNWLLSVVKYEKKTFFVIFKQYVRNFQLLLHLERVNLRLSRKFANYLDKGYSWKNILFFQTMEYSFYLQYKG